MCRRSVDDRIIIRIAYLCRNKVKSESNHIRNPNLNFIKHLPLIHAHLMTLPSECELVVAEQILGMEHL
jgi:hypothetical protein